LFGAIYTTSLFWNIPVVLLSSLSVLYVGAIYLNDPNKEVSFRNPIVIKPTQIAYERNKIFSELGDNQIKW